MAETHTIKSDALLDILAYAKEAAMVYTSRELHIGFINRAMRGMW